MPTYPPVPDSPGLGPAMAAIEPKQRAFVQALIDSGGNNRRRAATLAGYGNTPESSNTAAHRLAHDPKIVAAIKEEAEKVLHSAVALGAKVLVEIASDPMHKDRLKAAQSLLDRGGLLLVQRSEVVHTHRDDNAMIERITILAQALNLDPAQLLGNIGVGTARKALSGPVVDAEFTEIVGTADGLEDLL